MNDRNIAILTEIIKHPDIKSKKIEAKLHLTRRQLSYSIDQINTELSNDNLPTLQRTPLGTILVSAEIINYFLKDKINGKQKKCLPY